MIVKAQDIKHEFLPLPVKAVTETMKARITKTELAFVNLAEHIFDLVPHSAHRTAAYRKLLEAKQACVQAITRTDIKIGEPQADGVELKRTAQNINNG